MAHCTLRNTLYPILIETGRKSTTVLQTCVSSLTNAVAQSSVLLFEIALQSQFSVGIPSFVLQRVYFVAQINALASNNRERVLKQQCDRCLLIGAVDTSRISRRGSFAMSYPKLQLRPPWDALKNSFSYYVEGDFISNLEREEIREFVF